MRNINKNDLNQDKKVIDGIVNKIFDDINLEIDFSQGGVSIGIKRYNRSELIIGIYDRKISIEDLLLFTGLNSLEFKNDKEKDLFINKLVINLIEKYNENPDFEDPNNEINKIYKTLREYYLDEEVGDNVSGFKGKLMGLIKK